MLQARSTRLRAPAASRWYVWVVWGGGRCELMGELIGESGEPPAAIVLDDFPLPLTLPCPFAVVLGGHSRSPDAACLWSLRVVCLGDG